MRFQLNTIMNTYNIYIVYEMLTRTSFSLMPKQKINLNYLLLGNLANQALREQQSYVMVKSALSKAASDSQLRIISC